MLSEIVQKTLEEVIASGIEAKEVAGLTMMVIQDGEEIFYHEDGLANIETGSRLKRDSIFRLYSMSKPVTAAAVMILFERGLIDLYDSVGDFLPGFRNQKVAENGKIVPVKRDMHIKDLLNMTSGLCYPGEDVAGAGTAALFEEVDRRLLGDEPMSTYDIMNALGRVPLAFHPGENWNYGTSADVLAAIVEVVSGKRFGDFLQEEIFGPLGMRDTGFYVPVEKRDRLATTYETVYSPEGAHLETYTGNNLGIINAMDRNPAYEAGGAGLVSTVDDYAKFATMLINNGSLNGVDIFKPRTVEFLSTQVLNDQQMEGFKNWHTFLGYSYGNLMRVCNRPDLAGGQTRYGEYGWDGWLGCYFANFPEENATIIVMMQKKDAGTTRLTRKIRNIVLSEL